MNFVDINYSLRLSVSQSRTSQQSLNDLQSTHRGNIFCKSNSTIMKLSICLATKLNALEGMMAVNAITQHIDSSRL